LGVGILEENQFKNRSYRVNDEEAPACQFYVRIELFGQTHTGYDKSAQNVRNKMTAEFFWGGVRPIVFV
jgi:hypothetical protein